MATIDNLDIRISASFNQAAAAIRRLNSQLDSTTARLRNVGREINTPIRRLNSQLDSTTARLRNVGTTINAAFSSTTKSSRKLEKSISKINTPVKALTNELKRTAAQFLTIRAAFGGIQKSIQNSMNYIETLNYFERAFEQVASKADLSAFSEMGYNSAEEYFNSFSERAKELTSKMSGFNINADGTLTASGMPSLGIDPNKLMNYQAMFGQMSSSMGVASETSLKLSNALTMIGADLASVKNMNFDKVWEDMASGLAGMSRTLDKYGVNIRNVNLQQKLNELGIKANISALNQNDKALLRGIILLDTTRYAWGDLTNTLNQPANQLRLIEGNIQNLSRTIGNLLLPTIAKVLPYINGFVIALQRLFAWIGKIFKIDLSNLMPKGGGGGSGAISDLIGDTGELEDGLNAATAAAKKLNKQVRAFDELNVINTSSGGAGGAGAGGIGSGLLDEAFNEAYQEYLDAWNDAFANAEDKAQGIADKIQAFFKDLFKPIATAWDSEGNRVMAGWKRALQEVGKLVKDIGHDFMTMWQQQGTVDIFKDIFHIIGDIGFIVSNLAENFRIAWNTNEVGLHIFENIRDVIGAVTKNIRKAADYTVQWSKTLDFYPILSSIKEWTESLVPVFDSLSGTVSDFYTQVLLPLGKWTLEKGLPDLIQVFTDFNKKVDWEALRGNLSKFWEYLEPFAETVGEGLIIFIERVSDLVANFVNSETFVNFLHSIENWMDNVTPEDVADGIEKLAKAFIVFKMSLLGFSAVKTVLPIINNVLALSEKLSNFGGFAFSAGATAQVFDVFKNTKKFTENQSAFDETTAKLMELKKQLDDGSISLEEYNQRTEEVKNELIDFTSRDFKIPGVEYDENGWNTKLVELKNKLVTWWNTDVKSTFSSWGKDISEFWNENVSPWFTKEKWSELGENIKIGISTKWTEFTTWWTTTGIYNWWSESVAPWFTIEKWSELGRGILDGISTKWNEFKEWWGETAIVSWWDENVSPWFTVEKWHELGENIKTGISEKWNEFSEWWQTTGIYNWWNENVTPWFDKDKWSFSGIKEGLSEAWNAAINSVKQIWNKFAGWLNDKLTWTIDPISIAGKTVFEGATIDLGKIPMFAKGGVFRGGNPFMAIVNDQPRGQTNIEAPLKVIKQALREELTSLIDKFNNVQLTPTFKAGQFQPAPPPEFDFDARQRGAYQIAAEIQRENSGTYSNSDGYDNYSEEASLLMSQNQLLREQNRLLEQILRKPTMEISDVHKAIVRDSMERGGNIHGGNMGRLAVAQELYR